MKRFSVQLRRTVVFIAHVEVEATDDEHAVEVAESRPASAIEWGSAAEDDVEGVFEEVEEIE